MLHCLFCALIFLTSFADKAGACGSKQAPRPKATCEGLNEVSGFVEKFEEKFMKSTPDCDDLGLVEWYYSLRQNVYHKYIPKTIEEYYYLVKSDFLSTFVQASSELELSPKSTRVEKYKKMYQKISLMKYEIEKQIRNYWRIVGIADTYSEEAVAAGRLPNALDDIQLSCESLQILKDLFSKAHGHFTNADVECSDLRKTDMFKITIQKFSEFKDLQDTAHYLERYTKNGGDCSHNSKQHFAVCVLHPVVTQDKSTINRMEMQEKFRYMFRVMYELTKRLENTLKDIDSKIAADSCTADRVQAIGQKFCHQKSMINKIVGPLVVPADNTFTWFSEKTYPFFFKKMQEIIDNVKAQGETFVSLSLGLDSLQTVKAISKLKFCNHIGRNAQNLLDYARKRGVFVQYRLFASEHPAKARENWMTLTCVPAILSIIQGDPYLHSVSVFTRGNLVSSGCSEEDDLKFEPPAELLGDRKELPPCPELASSASALMNDSVAKDPKSLELFFGSYYPCKIFDTETDVLRSVDAELLPQCFATADILLEYTHILQYKKVLATDFVTYKTHSYGYKDPCSDRKDLVDLDLLMVEASDSLCDYLREKNPTAKHPKPILVLKPNKKKTLSKLYSANFVLEYAPM